MASDYEKFYQENPNGFGEPTQVFVDFFNDLKKPKANVLDVGCGQGRDALFIARKGHQVRGVDISPTGVANLLASAEREGLTVSAEVADIRDYDWNGTFDIILIDRTLHMLQPDEQRSVLLRILATVTIGTHILIADERTNIPRLQEVLDRDALNWVHTFKDRSYLFAVAA